MVYAIVESGNKQYKVSSGDEIDIELTGKSAAKSAELNVLLVSDGDDVKIGTPYVKGATVQNEIIDEVKDKKVISFKYKNKTGYHKTIGHRQKYSRLKIGKISVK